MIKELIAFSIVSNFKFLKSVKTSYHLTQVNGGGAGKIKKYLFSSYPSYPNVKILTFLFWVTSGNLWVTLFFNILPNLKPYKIRYLYRLGKIGKMLYYISYFIFYCQMI